MYESIDELDLTKLETYIIERPPYADTRRQAYADWALDELLTDILAEFSTPPWWYSGEYTVPYDRIINRFIFKMRKFRNLAPPGKKLMFSIAIKEAESLKTVFVKGERYENETQQKRGQDGRTHDKANRGKERSKNLRWNRNRFRGRNSRNDGSRNGKSSRDR